MLGLGADVRATGLTLISTSLDGVAGGMPRNFRGELVSTDRTLMGSRQPSNHFSAAPAVFFSQSFTHCPVEEYFAEMGICVFYPTAVNPGGSACFSPPG